MSSVQAILAGALLIACSILLSNGMPSANAMASGPYVMMHHSNTTANVGVFRMDSNTGEMSYCYLLGNGDLNCTNVVK